MFESSNDKDQEFPEIRCSSAQKKQQRETEKFLRQFQSERTNINVKEYTENFLVKNYANIRSKVYQVQSKEEQPETQKIQIKDKVLINRRVLNDYIHIVNRRQDLVNTMEDNFWTMVKLQDGTLNYFNKYYGKQLEDQVQKLNELFKPEHRYLLKGIEKNGARIKRHIQQYEQIKNESDPRLKNALKECKNIEEIVNKNQEQIKQRQNQLRNQEKPEGQLDQLSKKKGYMIDEKDVEQKRENQIIMNEVQKFGSDRIKRQLFEQDMKVILENQEIQDKIHQIQMSIDKMNALNSSNKPSNYASPTNNANQGEEEEISTRLISNSQINPSQSLQHIKMQSPSSFVLDLKATQMANSAVSSAVGSPKITQISNRRSSSNFQNQCFFGGIQKQITSPALQQIKENAGFSKSIDRFSLNSINEIDDDLMKNQEIKSSIFSMSQNKIRDSNNQIFSSQTQDNFIKRDLNLQSPQIEHDNNNLKQIINTIDIIDFSSPNYSTQSSASKMKSRFIFDNINQSNQTKKIKLNGSDSSALNTPTSNGDKKMKSVVSFVLSTEELSGLTPKRNSFINDKLLKQVSPNTFYQLTESKFKFNKMQHTAGEFNTTKQDNVKTNLTTPSSSTLGERKASLDIVIGKISKQKTIDHKQQQQQKQQLSMSHLQTPLKPALKKSIQDFPISEVIGSSTALKTADTLCSNLQIAQNLNLLPDVSNNLVDENGMINFEQNNKISYQNLQNSMNNIQTINELSSQKFKNSFKRFSTLISSDTLQTGNMISNHKISKSMQLNSEKVQSSNILDEDYQQSQGKFDDNIKSEDENDRLQSQINISKQGEQIEIEKQKREYHSRNKKKKQSMDEVLGINQSVSADKINQQQKELQHQKPLIRNKIYKESDIFKYKKINNYAIQELYEKRILNMHKDFTPLLTVKELQGIEQKQKNYNLRINISHNHSKKFSWNNVDEKKADFLSLDKQRTLYFNPEQDQNIEKKITQLHGSEILDKYQSIQKNCSNQIEQSNSLSKDIKEGQSKFKHQHLSLKKEYKDKLCPKEYISKNVKEILEQTKIELNIKAKRKSRSQLSSPEKILQSLLKKDVQKWGKTAHSQSRINSNQNGNDIVGQKKDKKYSMFSSPTVSETEKKQIKEQSIFELEKLLEKYKNSSHSQSLQEQLNQLMTLDSKRKTLFGATQKMYSTNSIIQNKSKNKYLNEVLSNNNIDLNKFEELKKQNGEKPSPQSKSLIHSSTKAMNVSENDHSEEQEDNE